MLEKNKAYGTCSVQAIKMVYASFNACLLRASSEWVRQTAEDDKVIHSFVIYFSVFKGVLNADCRAARKREFRFGKYIIGITCVFLQGYIFRGNRGRS
jgi:hypothetical protein